MQILIHEIVYDIGLKFLLKIHDIIGDSKGCRHAPCVIHCAQSAASPLLFLYDAFFILPDLHRNPDHIISLFF